MTNRLYAFMTGYLQKAADDFEIQPKSGTATTGTPAAVSTSGYAGKPLPGSGLPADPMLGLKQDTAAAKPDAKKATASKPIGQPDRNVSKLTP